MSTEAVTAGVAPLAPSLRRSLAVQARVVRALLLRELITRFGRRNLGVLWLIAEPALFTLAVLALWTAAGFNRASNLPIVAFALTGYSSVLLWRNTASYCVNAIHQNLNLLYHRNVRVQDVFAARILLEIGGATAAFALLAGWLILMGQLAPPEDPLKVVAGWLMLCWFGAALGLALGGASGFSDVVARFWAPVSYILFPLSGALFMVSALPPAAQQVILLLPMVHGVEMIREGWFGSLVRTVHDIGYMAGVSLALSLLGLVLLRIAARRTEAR